MNRKIGFSRGDAGRQRSQRDFLNKISGTVVDAAVAVHRDLGPGLLESVCEKVLANELGARGLKVERQVAIPVIYKGMIFDEAFRADLIVDEKVMVELKAAETIKDVHKRQLLTYLKLSNIHLGLLLNFGSAYMRNGIIRLVNQLQE